MAGGREKARPALQLAGLAAWYCNDTDAPNMLFAKQEEHKQNRKQAGQHLQDADARHQQLAVKQVTQLFNLCSCATAGSC